MRRLVRNTACAGLLAGAGAWIFVLGMALEKARAQRAGMREQGGDKPDAEVAGAGQEGPQAVWPFPTSDNPQTH